MKQGSLDLLLEMHMRNLQTLLLLTSLISVSEAKRPAVTIVLYISFIELFFYFVDEFVVDVYAPLDAHI